MNSTLEFCPPRDCNQARRDLLLSGAALGAAMLLPFPVRAARFRVLAGAVLVNGRPAAPDTVIKPGDRIATGPGAKVVFAVGSDAFLLHGDSDLKLEAANRGDGRLIDGLRMLTGALLAVFDKGARRLETPMMTIGIRGTGVYLAANQDATTLCTCYGDVDVWNRRNGEHRRVISGYHTPMMANADGLTGHMPMKKGMDMGHSDEELAMLEELVGRVSPIELRQQQLREAAEQARRDAAGPPLPTGN